MNGKNQIKLIAITGGPCSGKSELMEHLQTTDIGHRAMFVPEAATMILPGFLAVKKETDMGRQSDWQLRLQRCISTLQLSLEDGYLDAAQNEGKDIVLCDRGLKDAEIYTESAQSIYKEIGFTAEEILLRYHGVIHLESLATAAPDKFGSETNPQRYEDCQTAAQIEYRTREVWAGHPRWQFIAGQEHIHTKFAVASRAVCHMANAS